MYRRRRSRGGLVVGLLVVLLVFVGGLVVLERFSGATVGGILPIPSPPPQPTASPTPVTWDERARDVAQQFLGAWAKNDYNAMYALLSVGAKQGISEDRFVGRYQAIMSGAVITQVVGTAGEVSLFPAPSNPISGTIGFSVKMQSARVGPFEEQNTMPLAKEGNGFRVDWSPALIFRDLTSDTFVQVDPEDPQRGTILDRKGRVLAGPGMMVSIGLVPGNVKDEGKALQALSDFLGMPQQAIKAKYANAKPDWWVPLRDLPESRRREATSKLGGIAGIELREKAARTYPNGSLAAHVIGYMGPTKADDLSNFAAQGYEEGDYIGREGIEAWSERDLAGVKGGRLLIADADGNTVRAIAQRKAQGGKAVQLTVDLDVQQMAEKALGDKVGSIVVLDPRDNSVLAMVSHPGFDPNAFVTGISDQDWQKLSGDASHPFQNRATLSAYPTGSIFKVVTMDAALEKGGFRPDTPFDCNGVWTGLPGVVMRDWVPQGHGRLDLQEGLVESCNIVFYELGKKLDSIDSRILPDYAKQFGLGQPTGLNALAEAKGTVPDPDWKQSAIKQPWYPGDAVNLGIGQGYLEATPLQMANVYASLANGGELRTPVLVRQVGQGSDAKQFTTQVRGRIPGSAATLATIRVAMKQVASSPKGTAYYAFQGFQVPTAAKTGSAENQNPNAHAWFAGYAPADAPQIVVLVMVEGGKAGGEIAAPLGRQIMAGYFAQPQ